MDAEGPETVPPTRDARAYWAGALRRAWQLAIELVTWAWKEMVVRHLFTVPAVLLAAAVLFVFPQTMDLLWQLPSLDGLTVPEALSSLVFYLFLLLIIVGYLVLLWAMMPERRTSAVSRRGLVRRITEIPERVGTILDWPASLVAASTARRVLLLGQALLVVGVLFQLVLWWFDASLPGWWRVTGTTYAVLLVLAGGWLLCMPSPPVLPGFRVRLLGRVLGIVIATMVLGQWLWALPGWSPEWFSPRIFTVWAIFQIAFLIVMSARVIDACHLHSRWNIRALVVLVTIGWLWLVPGDTVGRFWRLPPRPVERVAPGSSDGNDGELASAVVPPAVTEKPERSEEASIRREPIAASTLPMDETVVELWFRAMEARLAQTDPDHPVIIVAASGGGARAAMFTALVFEALRNTSLPPAPPAVRRLRRRAADRTDVPGSTRKDQAKANGKNSAIEGPAAPASAPYRAQVEAELAAAPDEQPSTAPSAHSLADQVVLISSVSGGSVASAYYVSQTYPHLRVLRDRDLALDQQIAEGVPPRPRIRYAWRNSFANDIYSRMRRRSLRMLDAARSGRASEVSDWAGSRFENAVERVAYECERLARGGNIWRTAAVPQESIAPWLATSAFVDDMATDFMAPLLRGILYPGLARGVSVTRFWEEEFGWRDVEDTDLHRKPHPTRPELGAVANGAPPVLFNTCDVKQGTRLIVGFPPVPPGIIRDPLAGTSSHLPYSLTDRGNLYYHVSLAEAVRLSANFPFGFEVARLPVEGTAETVLALDGGIVDNSGIDSIVYLFQGLERLAKAYRQEWRRLAIAYRQADSDERRDALWHELTELSCKRIEGRAFRLLGELARRKVVLLQIDSGAKVIETGGSAVTRLLASLAPVILRPVQALNNTTYTNAELSVHQYDLALATLKPQPPPPCDCEDSPALSRLEPFAPAPMMGAGGGGALPRATGEESSIAVPDPVPLPPPPLVLRVRFTCNQSANIMTAWTLGAEDKAQVLVQFLIEWDHQRPVLMKALEIESQVRIHPPDPRPGQQPHVDLAPVLAREYQAFVSGQNLADRARAEFYQRLSTANGDLSGPAGQSTLVIDEAARRDMENYDKLFRPPVPNRPVRRRQAPAAGPPEGQVPLPPQ